MASLPLFLTGVQVGGVQGFVEVYTGEELSARVPRLQAGVEYQFRVQVRCIQKASWQSAAPDPDEGDSSCVDIDRPRSGQVSAF